MKGSDALHQLEAAVQSRSARRGLTADSTRLRYLNRCLFGGLPGGRASATLYVGVGHGLDALLALQQQLTDTVVGVDPYIGAHGNDDDDYQTLLTSIEKLGLSSRLTVYRSTIEDYLSKAHQRFDCIICNDVLHHIFVTEELLCRSRCYSQAVHLFRDLSKVTRPDCTLIISEVERHGLRPLLARCHVLRSSVNYKTKQPRNEWANAAVAGGWSFVAGANYVPWRLRGQRAFWSGSLGRFTLCDKYHLYFSRQCDPQ